MMKNAKNYTDTCMHIDLNALTHSFKNVPSPNNNNNYNINNNNNHVNNNNNNFIEVSINLADYSGFSN